MKAFLSYLYLSNGINSNFPNLNNLLCVTNQMLMLLVARYLGIFCIQPDLRMCQSNPILFKR